LSLFLTFQGQKETYSKSVAVGDKQFVKEIENRLGHRALGRKTQPFDHGYELREVVFHYSYNADFDAENEKIAPINAYKWNTFPSISGR
jgi:hypothetical protein